MKKIHYDHIPARISLFSSFSFVTALHYWNTPSWIIYGVSGIFFIVIISQLVEIFTQEYIRLD